MKQLLPFVLCSAVLLVAACGSPGKKAQAQPGSDSPVAAMLKAHQLEGRVVLVEFGILAAS
jgi:outer membrane biogenesis lipoprotein LolB